MKERNIKLTLEYDGTNYSGWQKQSDAKSIQETLENAILKITGEKVNLIGSGRTDSRVHALGQVANFKTNSKIPGNRFVKALNSMLPSDIAVRESIEVDDDFHARFNAIGKEYKYLIYNNKVRSPLKRNYSYFVDYDLDIEKMREALDLFLGTHDFRGFMSSGSSIKTTVRTISNIEFIKKEDIIELSIMGNGFLYNMVRIIVGTLVDIGIGKIDITDISDIIESCDRNKAGHTAPPEGLYLSKVFY